MGDPLAIAAATATLRNLLQRRIPQIDAELADLTVTARPPDVARNGVSGAQLNLFLYQVAASAAGRNQGGPVRLPSGERSSRLLEFDLHYLITAFGRDDADGDLIGPRVLGSAISTLQDHFLLGRDEIQSAFANTGVAASFEQIRIVGMSLSVEEMSNLWAIFQSPYRTSVAYQITIVLTDERTPEGPRPALDNVGSSNARRPESNVRLSDLDLPAQEVEILRQIVDQMQSRVGRGADPTLEGGVGVLFTGDRAGQTRAVDALANELGLRLGRVDLSGVISKYIGETEKNLREVFEAAQGSGVILLLDEADALFGKRTEVKPGNDRYANIEVNYLLLLIESYGALVILAADAGSAIDEAFMRRLKFVVTFPDPPPSA